MGQLCTGRVWARLVVGSVATWGAALALSACAGANTTAPPRPANAGAPARTGPASTGADAVVDLAQLARVLPAADGPLPPELAALRARVSLLLSVEAPAARPAEPAPGELPTPDPRGRAKIEAYFQTLQRWQDAHLLEVTELLGALMEGLGGPPSADRLRHALAGLLLEDQAALGFGIAPGLRLSGEVPEAQLAAALARPEVDFAGLSAQAYGRCAASSAAHPAGPPERPGAATLRALCVAGERRMRLRGRGLPQCAAPSLTHQPRQPRQPHQPHKPPAAEAVPAAKSATSTAAAVGGGVVPTDGLLLQGAYDVPLLESELTRLGAAANASLARLLGRPMGAPAPPTSPAGGQDTDACLRPPRPSEVLLSRAPGVRWHGLSLHCADARCGVTICSAHDDTCYRAPVQGPPSKLTAWLDALEGLEVGQGASLWVEPDPPGADSTGVAGVAYAVRAMHGPWGKRRAAAEGALAAHMPGLIACQGPARYEADWVVDADAAGRIRGLRVSSQRRTYPMDDRALLSPSQSACVRGQLDSLRLPRAGGRGPRRLLLAVRIAASLQVELPIAAAVGGPGGESVAIDVLARDAQAVRLAACVAGAGAEVDSVGLCAAVRGDGGVEGLAVDLSPLSAKRAREHLRPGEAPAFTPPAGVDRCLSEVLQSLPWTCRPGAEPRDIAVTLRLPRGLLERFRR